MDRLYQLTVSTMPGTTPDSPLVTQFPVEDSILQSITILIPDGHSGLTGIRLLQADQEIIPWSNNDWLISNNEIVTVNVDTQVSATALSIETYNTDVFAHSHWIRAVIADLGTSAATSNNTPSVIPADLLSNL